MGYFDWGELFKGIGQGVTSYGQLAYAQQQDKLQQEREKARLGLEQQRLDLEKQREWDSSIQDQRQAYMHTADRQAESLGKAGVVVPESFYQNSMAAQLPETGGQDVAGMAVNALRGAGKARQGEFYAGVPDALNRQWKSKSMATELPGGGFTYTPPEVRASLENAAATRDSTAAYRRVTTQMSQQRLIDEETKRKAGEDASDTEGITQLNSILAPEGGKPSNPELAHAFAPAFRAARQSNPTMRPGLLTKQVISGLQSTRADLFPKPPSTAQEELDPAAKLAKLEAAMKARADSAATPPTPPTPGPLDQAAAAQRFDELVSQGVSEEEATARVLQEFPGVKQLGQ